MSRFMRGLFQTARTISTIDPTAGYGPRGEAPPPPLFVVCATLEHMFRSIPSVLFRQCFGVSCCISRARARLNKRYPSGLSMCVDCVHISSYIYSLYFSVVVAMFFRFFNPLTTFRHADRTVLFQRFAVVCFLNLLTPLLVCIVITNNRLGSQPSKVGVTL